MNSPWEVIEVGVAGGLGVDGDDVSDAARVLQHTHLQYNCTVDGDDVSDAALSEHDHVFPHLSEHDHMFPYLSEHDHMFPHLSEHDQTTCSLTCLNMNLSSSPLCNIKSGAQTCGYWDSFCFFKWDSLYKM